MTTIQLLKSFLISTSELIHLRVVELLISQPVHWLQSIGRSILNYQSRCQSINHSELQSITHSFNQSFTTPFNHSQLQSIIHNFIQSFTTSINHPQLHSIIHNFIQSFTTSINHSQLQSIIRSIASPRKCLFRKPRF